MKQKENLKRGDAIYMKKTLSLILAVLMIIATMPVAFAVEPVVLTEANVLEWPSLEGTILYGQRASEVINVTGGIVTTDGTVTGTVIPGKFVIYDPPALPGYSSSGYTVSLNFVPDDTELYTGFEQVRNSACKVTVLKATPVIIDEENNPVVATDVEAGSKLSAATLSGGQVKNPVNPDESKALAAKWRWVSTSTVVDKSGYYQARMVISNNYEVIYKDVYVNVKGNAVETEILKTPSLDFEYDGITNWTDISFDDGIVVEKGTENAVEGTFSILTSTNTSMTGIMNAGLYENLKLRFTPTDLEKYLPCETTISVTVNKATPAWKDSQTPVITVSYGTTVTDLLITETLKNLVNVTGAFNFYLYGADGTRYEKGVLLNSGEYEEEYKLKVSGIYTDIEQNWDTENTYLPVKIIVEPGKAEITSNYNIITNKLEVLTNSRYLNGTFDIYIDGELAFDDVTAKNFEAEWTPADTSKDSVHTLKVVYNKADNDNAVIENAYESTFNFKAIRVISVGEKSNSVKIPSGNYNPDPNNTSWGTRKLFAGDEVKISAGLPDFRYWVIKDMNGNEVDLGIDKNSNIVTFIMPDYDISIDYVCQFELDAIAEKEEAINNCKCLCHDSDNEFVQFFWNVFVTIIDILENLFGTEILCECGYDHCA